MRYRNGVMEILSVSLLILFLLLLAYTAVAIKEEKHSYRETAVPVHFHHFKFSVPSWWRLHKKEPNYYLFTSGKQSSPSSRWQASLHYGESPKSIIPLAFSILKERGIEFDKGNDVIQISTHHPVEIVRIEGAATVAGVQRRYIDLFVVRDLKSEGHLLALSESDILDGMVEGPYFEEVLLNFSLNFSSSSFSEKRFSVS